MGKGATFVGKGGVKVAAYGVKGAYKVLASPSSLLHAKKQRSAQHVSHGDAATQAAAQAAEKARAKHSRSLSDPVGISAL